MTSDGSRINTLITDGDYFEALGMRLDSEPTDIAVAAARLAGEHPDQARRINAVASVLRNPEQREIYMIAHATRDNIVSGAFEPQLRAALPDIRQQVWSEVQRVLRCEFELGQVDIGPRAARSLLQRSEWIKEVVINNSFLVLAPRPEERRIGVAYRTLIFRTDCAECGGTTAATCDCSDDYRFDIPSGAAPGVLLGARGARTGRFMYMILDRPVSTARPSKLLHLVYAYHRNRATIGEGSDLTLEEARAKVRRVTLGTLSVLLGVSALLGFLLSSWLVGLIAVLPAVAMCLASAAEGDQLWMGARRIWPLALVAQPVAGTLAGHILATALSGLILGLVLSISLLLFDLLARRYLT